MSALLAALMLAVVDLAPLFEDAAAWQQPAVRYAPLARRGAAVWHDIPVWETRFVAAPSGTSNQLARVEMSLYNRGDDKTGAGLDGAALRKLLNTVAAQLGGMDITKAQRRRLRDEQQVYTLVNSRCDPAVELVWGTRGKAAALSADFVRLTLMKTAKPARSAPRASEAAKNHVQRNAAGDVWIEGVPMVDQGAKGYCAVAVTERVLRYYGQNIDEHQLAQMAGSTAEGGTSTDAMLETVRRLASKCHLGFNEIVAMNGSMKDIRKEIEAYNKAAKALKARPLEYNSFLAGNTFMLNALRAAEEPEVLLRMRTKDARFKKFLAGVKMRVDQGVPVFWGVTLGIFQESDIPQKMGGHMRLVIGYNARTHEILYSDTWGAGHELKRMPEARAFAITHDAFSLRPL